MPFHIPVPPSHDLPTLTERILVRHSQAEDALKQIESASNDLPFGTPISHIHNHYHFATVESTEAFFRVYLALRRGANVDNEMILKYMGDTINCLDPDYLDDRDKNDRAFSRIFQDLLNRIRLNSAAHKPTVNFLVGPTGAGKTVFSKSLFTVCLRKFWAARIIPCRVEYTKYPQRNNFDNLTFFHHMRLCQFRDLVIYLFASGEVDLATQNSLISQARLDDRSLRPLRDIQQKTCGLVIDGETVCLNGDNRALFDKSSRAIPDQDKVSLVHLAAHELGLKYAISFDGFDSTRIEHFLFDERVPLPVAPLVSLLKGLHEKTEHIQPREYHTDNHYLLYLRDTTFERLRSEIVRGVGGPKRYPIYWIVPPKYELLVENVGRFVTRNEDPAIHKSNVFSADLFFAFDHSIFEGMHMNAAVHMNFVFGSNARHMKRHIKQLLNSAMNRASQAGTFDSERAASGVDAKTVWVELISDHGVRKLPQYLLYEDLFLDETRQLFPKLQLDPEIVTQYLANGDFAALLQHVQDRDEETGIFGCLFNYFYSYALEWKNDRQPAILLLIRILQFVEKNARCVSGQVREFLESIGYRISLPAFHFAVFVLIRTELIKWDGTSDARQIGNVPLYITTKGTIALNKLMFSTSYISESICGALHMDLSLSRRLRGRHPDNATWIADCLNNASIALFLIRCIEQIEGNWARKSDIFSHFQGYRIYARLKNQLSREAKAILTNRITRRRWAENVARLREVRRDYPDLEIFRGD